YLFQLLQLLLGDVLSCVFRGQSLQYGSQFVNLGYQLRCTAGNEGRSGARVDREHVLSHEPGKGFPDGRRAHAERLRQSTCWQALARTKSAARQCRTDALVSDILHRSIPDLLELSQDHSSGSPRFGSLRCAARRVKYDAPSNEERSELSRRTRDSLY